MKHWRADEDVTEIAENLIGRHHPHLADVRIGYLFREKAGKKGGKEVLGTAERFPEKMSALFEEDEDPAFLITLAWDAWQRATQKQRMALIDHELSHCIMEPGEKPYDKEEPALVGHDFEEFTAIVQRHGVWKEDLEDARLAFVHASAFPRSDVERAAQTFRDAIPEGSSVTIESGGHKATFDKRPSA